MLPSETTAKDVIASSGNARTDLLLGDMLVDMSVRFNIRPGFGFYRDGLSLNAFATPTTFIPATSGTVMFGTGMFSKFLNLGVGGDTAIMGVCAHEFAHIVQFFSEYRDRLLQGRPTVMWLELHADFLAGYYLGAQHTPLSYEQLRTLGRAWENLGDSDFRNVNHHGTPVQRLSAIESGFAFAERRIDSNILDACHAGYNFVSRIS